MLARQSLSPQKIVEPEIIERNPNFTIVPGFQVSAIVEQPWGAYPAHLDDCYNGDPSFIKTVTRDEQSYDDYLKNFVYGVNNWDEYLKKLREIQGEYYFNKLLIRNPM